MEPLLIQATETTPNVSFDATDGLMEIRGASFDEDSTDFYENLILWITKYRERPNSNIVLNLHFKYLNSSSTLCVYELLREFAEIQSNGCQLTVNWYYGQEDEDIKDAGIEYSELLQIPINVAEDS
jgi:hypothetical protein